MQFRAAVFRVWLDYYGSRTTPAEAPDEACPRDGAKRGHCEHSASDGSVRLIRHDRASFPAYPHQCILPLMLFLFFAKKCDQPVFLLGIRVKGLFIREGGKT